MTERVSPAEPQPSRNAPVVVGNIATTEGMLASALVGLEAAEALERLLRVALTDHHQPIGALVEMVMARHFLLRSANRADAIDADADETRFLDSQVIEAGETAADLVMCLVNMIAGRERGEAGADLAAAVRQYRAAEVTPHDTSMPIALSLDDTKALIDSLLVAAVDDGARRLRAVRYRGLARLEVFGRPVERAAHSNPPLSSEGPLAVAGGLLNRRTDGAAVAEMWIPIARPRPPRGVPPRVPTPPTSAPELAAKSTPPVVGWVAPDRASAALARETAKRSGYEARILATNGALLAAAEVEHFTAVVIRLHDQLNAVQVGDTLRAGGSRPHVALSRNCDEPEHRVDGSRFDRVFPFPFDTASAVAWLLALREDSDASERDPRRTLA